MPLAIKERYKTIKQRSRSLQRLVEPTFLKWIKPYRLQFQLLLHIFGYLIQLNPDSPFSIYTINPALGTSSVAQNPKKSHYQQPCFQYFHQAGRVGLGLLRMNYPVSLFSLSMKGSNEMVLPHHFEELVELLAHLLLLQEAFCQMLLSILISCTLYRG